MSVDIATLAIRIDSLEAREAARNLNGLGDAGGRAETAMQRVTSAAKGLVAAFSVMKIMDYAREATLLASRYNELGIVMSTLGKNAGYSKSALLEIQTGLEKTGISALESRNAIAKLISAHIDLSQASKLARLAQDAAVIGGVNSSEAYARLVSGIQSAEVETLRNLGLNVNFQSSYEKLAGAIGKSSKDLTELEKTQARVNAVMDVAPTIAGAYEASMTNAGKQMRSMSRHLENLQIELGQPFQDPFVGLVSSTTKALKYLNENVETLKNGISAIIAAIEPGAKIAAAYFAIFIAAPAILAATAAAFAPIIAALAVFAMNVMIGQTQALYFNRTLFGMSISAELAAGSLTKLMLAGSVLFAAFAGWQIGTYLREQFVEARIAGLAFVGLMLKGWENLKYGGEMAWEGVKFAFEKSINVMKSGFGSFLTGVASGLDLVGASDTSKQINAYADSLRSAAATQKTFTEQTAGLTAAHDKAIDVIDTNIVEMIAFELTAKKVVKAEEDVKKATEDSTDVVNKKTEATKAATDAIEQQLAALRLQVATLGMADDAATLYEMQLDGATKAQLEQAKSLLALIGAGEFYIDQAKAKYDASSASIKAATDEAEANERLARTFGMAKSAIEALELARLQGLLAQEDSGKGTTEEIARLQKLIDLQQRNVSASRIVEGKELGAKNDADVSDIAIGLLSPSDRDDMAHADRMNKLAINHAAIYGSQVEANILMEAEVARHEKHKSDIREANNIASVGMAGDAAGQLYSIMEKAGKEQSALGKALFIANKALAVAEIIMNANLAASKTEGALGLFGIPMATYLLASGYARAGMVAGLAIAEVSAEGGYDIPAGVNPLVQAHAKEMILPKAQADVIRGMATRSEGGSSSGDFKLTLVTNGTPQKVSGSQVMSDGERILIIEDAKNAAVGTINAHLGDPNSKTSRAMSRNFSVQRSR